MRRTERNATGRAEASGLSFWARRAGLAVAFAWCCVPASASDARLGEDFDAIFPAGETACFVGDFSDPLVARLKLHRLEETLSSNPDETGPGRGVLAIVDLTPRVGAEPAGSQPGAALAGRAYCSASRRLGAISCSDDSGCDRADRVRLDRTSSGVRLTLRGPFAFAGSACGGADDDDDVPGLELPDPRSKAQSFELERRPIDECR